MTTRKQYKINNKYKYGNKWYGQQVLIKEVGMPNKIRSQPN